MKAMLFAAAALAIAGGPAVADDKVVKIGVLTDLSSVYSDPTGPGSVLAAQMAVEDSGLTAKGWTIDVLPADHLNKPDVGSGIARKWFDEDHVDVACHACQGSSCPSREVSSEERTLDSCNGGWGGNGRGGDA